MLEIQKKISIDIRLFHTNYNLHSESNNMNEYCVSISKKHDLEIYLEKCDAKNLIII